LNNLNKERIEKKKLESE